MPETLPLDLLPPELEITYTDSNGEKTVRQISLKKIEKAGRTIYLYAYCYKRKALRSFKFGSISRMIDTQTGEVLNLKSLKAS